jgi:hypothetical protein
MWNLKEFISEVYRGKTIGRILFNQEVALACRNGKTKNLGRIKLIKRKAGHLPLLVKHGNLII